MITQAPRAALLTPTRELAAMQSTIVTADTVMITEEPELFNKADRDGLDHINIDARGRTTLGQKLAHMYHVNFVHPEYGPFRSVEGLIGFIRSGALDDQFHWVHGMEARYLSRKLESGFIMGFREIVMEANYFKIVQNEELREEFVNSTLPFDHYYLFETNGRPIQPPAAPWLIPAMESLRTLIRAGEAFPQADYSGVAELAHQRQGAK